MLIGAGAMTGALEGAAGLAEGVLAEPASELKTGLACAGLKFVGASGLAEGVDEGLVFIAGSGSGRLPWAACTGLKAPGANDAGFDANPWLPGLASPVPIIETGVVAAPRPFEPKPGLAFERD